MILEACVETLQEAINAQNSGAHQLELCSQLHLEGLTPSVELLRDLLNNISIPIKIMIRPRAGDFYYTAEEKTHMIQQIKDFEAYQHAGYVLGALDSNRLPDTAFVNELSEHVDGKAITFHKAIDQSSDIFRSIELLESECPGVKFILSSAGADTAELGLKRLKEMKLTLRRIKLIGAGKITPSNIERINNYLELEYYHGRSIV